MSQKYTEYKEYILKHLLEEKEEQKTILEKQKRFLE